MAPIGAVFTERAGMWQEPLDLVCSSSLPRALVAETPFLIKRQVPLARGKMKHDLQVAIIEELMSQLDEGRNVDAGVQYKMTTQSYVCPEIAEQEQKHFFMDHPQLIGLSGDFRRLDPS